MERVGKPAVKSMACRAFSEPGRIASFMGSRIAAASPGAKEEFGNRCRTGAGKLATEGQKCQRPRTTGARTSGAALLLRGRPGMTEPGGKAQRRPLKLNRNRRHIPQGAGPGEDSPKPSSA